MEHAWATVTKHDWFMTRGKTSLSASFSDIEVCRNCGCLRRNGKDDQPCQPRPLPDFEEIYRVQSSPLETRVCMVCKAEVRCQSWVPEPMMCEPCLEENEAMEIRAEALDDEI